MKLLPEKGKRQKERFDAVAVKEPKFEIDGVFYHQKQFSKS
ncbi:hypothetical protein ACEYW6_14870 [Nostoc sp. UIC 10607]